VITKIVGSSFALVVISCLWPLVACGQRATPQSFDDLEIKPITQRPCLLMDPSDVADVKRRFEAMPNHPPADPKKMDSALYALLFGDEAAKKRATADFMAEVRSHLKGDAETQFGRTNSYSSLRRCRRFNEMLYKYDLIASFGYLTKEERQEFEDDGVRAVKFLLGDDPAKFPSPQTPSTNGLEFPNGFSTCNRWPDQFMGAMLLGLNFPDQPLAKDWVRYGLGQIQYMLDHGNWDGAWNEVPRYHDWTMLIFSSLFEALKRRTGVDFYQDPNTKALADWYVRFSSPLVRFPETMKLNPQGEPTLPAWGDSSYGDSFFEACAIYAPQYATTDPALSKRLMWMWRRAGSPYHNAQFGLEFPILADPNLPDEPQTLGSDFCRKFGYVLMRSGFNTPEETVLYMRGGQQGITHQRSDLGSIDLFSQGIPLALGSESGPYNDSGAIEWNRSQISNNDVVFGGKSRDRSQSSGKIDAFYTSPEVDYAVADCSRPADKHVEPAESFHWRRHLLLVKQPDYLVVWDEISSTMPSEWFLHTTADHFTWQKDLVTSHTAYNADLDIHVLSPSESLVPNEKEGRFGEPSIDPKKPGKVQEKEDPYPFYVLKYFSIPAKPGEDFITVLHPRKPDGAPLKATLLSSSKDRITLQINLDDKTDMVTLGVHGASFQRGNSAVINMPMQIVEPLNPERNQ
jgi:hypothetical protein